MQAIDNLNNEPVLLAAWLLDGKGGGRELDLNGIKNWVPDQGALWLHLDRESPAAREWISGESDIDPISLDAMFEEESRPRCTLCERGEYLIINLRTPNINPEEEVDDMLSVRLWTDGNRIVTTRRLPIRALQAIDERLKKHRGPLNASDFVETLCRLVTETIIHVLSDLEDQIIETEKALTNPQLTGAESQNHLIIMQRKVINLRRYIVFQPSVLYELEQGAPEFLQEKDLRQIRDAAQKMKYAQSWVESLYDRSFNCQQQMYMRVTTRTGRTTYLLTVVASIFLPLTFLTGLLGANIGGIPGADYPMAFWLFSGLCLLVIAVQLLLLKYLHWF